MRNFSQNILGRIVLALLCMSVFAGCQQTRLENLVDSVNYQCPYYLENGFYFSQIYIDYDEGAVVLEISQDNELGHCIYGGLLGITGQIGINTYFADQILQEMRRNSEFSQFLTLCRNTGADIIFDVCGEELRIDSWKL